MRIKYILVGCSEIDKITIKDNVILVPPIKDKNELRKYYSLADLFCICSKQDNFPTTCIEAQCCGTRVCGFDVGGVKETEVEGEWYESVAYRPCITLYRRTSLSG